MPGSEPLQKAEYVRKLGSEHVVAIGQGANDAEMLAIACLGSCVMSVECVSKETLLACDLIAPTILSALELLVRPMGSAAGMKR